MPRDLGVAEPYTGAPGAESYQKLIAGGFSQAEADQWRAQQDAKLRAAGFSPSEVDNYWGNGTPSSPALQQHVSNNIQAATAQNPKIADDPLHAFLAGWDRSVVGLVINRKAPDSVTPHSAGLVSQITNATGQFIGDAPASVVGFFAGGAVGAAVTSETGPGAVVGTAVGAGAGMTGLPEASRQTLLAAYSARDGNIRTWQDAVHVAAHGSWETGKAAITGSVGMLVGGPVGGKLLDAGVAPTVAGGVGVLANATAATAAGSALNGHVPDAKDFTTSALMALGMHGLAEATPAVKRVQSNLQEIYTRTGTPPWQAVEYARSHPAFRDELMSQDLNGEAVIPNFRANAPGEPEPAVPRKPAAAAEDNRPESFLPPEMRETKGPKQRPDIAAIDPTHAKDLLRQLEGSKDSSVSPAGAIGRYQIMPATARQYMGKDVDVQSLHDPAVNEAVADRVIADLHRRYNGDMNAIAIAYNAGPKRAGEYLAAGPGTRLEAELDPGVRGGIRYIKVEAAKNESMLPLETQKYLANARRIMHGDLPAAPGEPPVDREFPSTLAAEGQVEPKDTTDEDNIKTILSNIGEEPSGEKLSLDRTLGQFFSELTPARNIDSRLIKEGDYDRTKTMGLEDQFRQTYASDTRAGAFIRYGVVDPETMSVKPDSPSFMKAAESVRANGGDMDGWKAYMLGKRTVDKAEQGVSTGFDEQASLALSTSKAAQAKYEEATRIFNEVNDGALDYAWKSGLFSEAQVAAMREANPAYISMRRIMGDDESFRKGAGRGFRAKDPLRKMEGSKRQIIDPLTATIDNIRLMVKNADRNRAIGAVIQLAETGKLPELGVSKVDDVVVSDKGADLDPYRVDKAAVAPLLAQRTSGSLKPTEFLYYRDGVAERWQAKDPALAQLMRGADSPGQANIVTKTLQTFASVERAGIVLSPDFPTKVQLRHQITAFIMDPLHPPPFITWMSGIMHVVNQDALFQDAVAKGAMGVALADMDANWLARDMHAVFNEGGIWNSVWNAVSHPLEFSQLVSERLDAAARVGYIKHAEAKGVEPLKAATMSRKAYLDYAERGTAAIANGMAQVVPFFRPRLLGMKQGWEAFSERPVDTLVRSAVTVALPIIAFYGLNHRQDKELPDGRKSTDLPRWERDSYFITPEIDGVRLKLRLPPNVGMLFGGMVNRALDAMAAHDPHAFEDAMTSFLQEYIPPLLPTVAQPPIEAITNHSFFTGKALIPASLEANSGYLQYTAATSETAKGLARYLGPPGLDVMDLSPIQFDNYVRGWGGTLGQDVLKALDVPFTGSKRPWEVADIPFVGSFVVRNPSMGAQPIQDFYDGMDKLETAHADYALAMKHAEEGNADDVAFTAPAGQYADAIEPIKQAISAQADAIKAINANAKMSGPEKRQAIDQIYPQLVQTAKAGLVALDNLPKTGAPPQEDDSVPAPPPDPNASLKAAAPPPVGENRGMVPVS